MAYKPSLGGTLSNPFASQFPNAKISSISLSTVLIEHLANDGTDEAISHGTGFCWRHGPDVYLITARHVFSGRDPFLNETMSKQNGFIPLRYRAFICVEAPPGSNQWGRGEVRLERADDEDKPWLEDPEFEALRTDIAAWKLDLFPNPPVKCLNDDPLNFKEMMTFVGFDCFIVGYPTPARAGLMTPVWRKGALASEPLLAVDNKPMFLIDAATSPGFSGSPVFRRHVGPLPVEENGQISIYTDHVIATCFVGVYAGRLTHSVVGGEVPFAFYGNRISAILGNAK